MQAVGVVVEYNPFHNGHQYHLKEARKKTGAEVVVGVMSGNFLQRGEPAILDKWTRARIALEHGCDVVIELPVSHAVQSADFFAYGAIRLLADLQVKAVCFGTEETTAADGYSLLADLYIAHQAAIDAVMQASLKKFPNVSYPERLTQAIQQVLPAYTGRLAQPNDLLGFSYAKALAQLAPEISLVPIRREANHYHDQMLPDKSALYASATAIRQAVFAQESVCDFVPPAMAQALAEQPLMSWEAYWPFLRYRLLSTPPQELARYAHVEEGLEFLLIKAAEKTTSFALFMNAIKSKRYTWVRLQRVATAILLGLQKSEVEMQRAQLVHRVLGVTRQGQAYLKAIKGETTFPLLTKLTKASQPALAIEKRASEIYQLGNPAIPEQHQHPIIRIEKNS